MQYALMKLSPTLPAIERVWLGFKDTCMASQSSLLARDSRLSPSGLLRKKKFTFQPRWLTSLMEGRGSCVFSSRWDLNLGPPSNWHITTAGHNPLLLDPPHQQSLFQGTYQRCDKSQLQRVQRPPTRCLARSDDLPVEMAGEQGERGGWDAGAILLVLVHRRHPGADPEA